MNFAPSSFRQLERLVRRHFYCWAFLILSRDKMDMIDFGKARFVYSKNLNAQLLVFRSERQRGLSYKFHKRNDTQFVCASC